MHLMCVDAKQVLHKAKINRLINFKMNSSNIIKVIFDGRETAREICLIQFNRFEASEVQSSGDYVDV